MILTDLAQIITGIGVIATSTFGYLNHRRLGDVKHAVNSTAQEQNVRTDQLTAALTEASVAVPVRRDPPAGA